MVTVKGKGGISAKVLAHSVSSLVDTQVISFEVEMPRIILAEQNTHRALSRNAASSRAIPTRKMLKLIDQQPAMPLFYGQNKKGMSATTELSYPKKLKAKQAILKGKQQMVELVRELNRIGLHKQNANRYIEAWQMVKVVITATELNNYFWLRIHEAAQPEIRELATCMFEAMQRSVPVELKPDEWHLPYFEDGYWKAGNQTPLKAARLISVSCCAQTSYRTNDTSLEKASAIFERLMGGIPKHSSPTEHQATPMKFYEDRYDAGGSDYKDSGTTHIDMDRQCWSGNFKHWIQYRQLIANQNLTEEFKYAA
jgi:hypothetical protein